MQLLDMLAAFGFGVALLSLFFRNAVGVRMRVIGLALGTACIVLITTVWIAGSMGLLIPPLFVIGAMCVIVLGRLEQGKLTVGRFQAKFRIQSQKVVEDSEPDDQKVLKFERRPRSGPRPL